ncbi:flagellar hook-basal body complex protein [Clostridium sp. JN-1]|uniref:flagellar hook-basal body complex protein n=1 Tax=Clostridium sp. JN-1 TaxID=2483110 RepID=UPI000F0BC0D2|nr:flagellar hook-basal body complex protein [Clostridium sp. JN-1]
MIRGLYTAVSGMITQEAKQDVITNNLANVNTVGFKKDNLAVRSFENMLMQNYDKVVGGQNVRNTIGYLNNGSKVDSVNTDFTSGTIQSTGKPTDFAIDGRGFFTVNRNGQNYYTRDGHFHVNQEGYLVTDSGDYVSFQQNQRLFVGNNKIVCDPQGSVKLLDSNNNVVGQDRFAAVDFDNYNNLQKIGDNLYQGNNPHAANITVRQNSLESSNVNTVNEMVDMITTMRTFETNQKIVQSTDETLDKVVNQVGSVR